MKVPIIIFLLISTIGVFAQEAIDTSYFAFVKGDTFRMGAVIRTNTGKENKPTLAEIGKEPGNLGGAYEGYSNEKPAHLVRLNSFYLAKTEISIAEFALFVKETAYITTAEQLGFSVIRSEFADSKTKNINWRYDPLGKIRDSTLYDHPVIYVSWLDAIAYCNWLSKKNLLQEVYSKEEKTGEIVVDWKANGYRLPTEAEWEFAAREGGKILRYGNGKNIADPKEINFNGWERAKTSYSIGGIVRNNTTPVHSFKGNALRLKNMSGNVGEWCWDWATDDDNYYRHSPKDNPKGPITGTGRRIRGGDFSSLGGGIRTTGRGGGAPPIQSNNIVGFRIALNARE